MAPGLAWNGRSGMASVVQHPRRKSPWSSRPRDELEWGTVAVTVGVNNMSVVHAGSNGVSIAFPDVCKTPAPPAPPIPIPYPNIAKSSDTAQGAKTVNCDGNPVCVKDSNFMVSTGTRPARCSASPRTR